MEPPPINSNWCKKIVLSLLTFFSACEAFGEIARTAAVDSCFPPTPHDNRRCISAHELLPLPWVFSFLPRPALVTVFSRPLIRSCWIPTTLPTVFPPLTRLSR
ncbi:hypothetical protein QBC35DRAFT_126203, partial [Podospora australis]